MDNFKSIPELVNVGKEGTNSLFETDKNESASERSPTTKYSFGKSKWLPSKTLLFMESPFSSSVCELLLKISINSEGMPWTTGSGSARISVSMRSPNSGVFH
jgi:hypothetical protein